MKKSEQIKQQIIENWLLHIHHDDNHPTKKLVESYIEEDHVDEVSQSGLYDLSKINWEQLKEQKYILLRMIQDWGEADDPDQRNDAKEAEGLLNLIDSIQDHAVDVMGLPENKVFNLSDD